MTTTLPRRIEPGEPLRKGWRVRAQRTMHGTVSATYEFTVDYEVRVGERVYAKDSGPHGLSFDRPDYTWTLIADVPEPARPVGSHWRDPENNVSYIVADDGAYLPYTYSEQGLSSLQPGSSSDADEIARLVPIPSRADLAEEVAVAASTYLRAFDSYLPPGGLAQAHYVLTKALGAWRAAQ